MALYLSWINYLFIESNWISFPTPPSPWANSRDEGKYILAYAKYKNASCPHIILGVIFTANL